MNVEFWICCSRRNAASDGVLHSSIGLQLKNINVKDQGQKKVWILKYEFLSSSQTLSDLSLLLLYWFDQQSMCFSIKSIDSYKSKTRRNYKTRTGILKYHYRYMNERSDKVWLLDKNSCFKIQTLFWPWSLTLKVIFSSRSPQAIHMIFDWWHLETFFFNFYHFSETLTS